MPKLTKSVVDNLPLPPLKPDGSANQVIYRDDALPSYGIRVGSGGTKAYFVERRINGRLKRITIGKSTDLTAEQARKRAQVLLAEIASGKDPVAEKKAKDAKSVTLKEALDQYFRSRKDLKPGTVANYKKSINGPLSDWLNKRLVDITKDMVQDRHREIGMKAPARANNVMRVLRAVFNHALEQYEDAQGRPILGFNPVDRLGKSRAWYPAVRRQTLLRPHQIKPWYDATQELKYEVVRDYLAFLLFTGLRKSEAANLTWADVDFQHRSFTITDTKNRDPHTLPITHFLMEILERRQAYAEEQKTHWVFPSPMGKNLREPRSSIRKVVEVSGVDFTLHDLRRTFITVAESLDIPAYALKRLLNHRNPNDVTAGYIITDVERLRRPMEKISQYLQERISDGQVG